MITNIRKNAKYRKIQKITTLLLTSEKMLNTEKYQKNNIKHQKKRGVYIHTSSVVKLPVLFVMVFLHLFLVEVFFVDLYDNRDTEKYKK
jgi:hypothetical protein